MISIGSARAGFAVLFAVLFEILAVVVPSSVVNAVEITHFRSSGSMALRYQVQVDGGIIALVPTPLATALDLLSAVPLPDFRVDLGSVDRFDLLIDMTTSELVRIEMVSAMGMAAASSSMAYSIFDRQTGRYVVRLLWDRIVKMRDHRGFLIDHPFALARLVSSLSREVYGSLRNLNMNRARRASGLLSAIEYRDSYVAGAETLSRIIAHKKFEMLAPRDQRDIRAAAAAEFESALKWNSLAESRRDSLAENSVKNSVKTSAETSTETLAETDAILAPAPGRLPPSNVFRFPSRCEMTFR